LSIRATKGTKSALALCSSYGGFGETSVPTAVVPEQARVGGMDSTGIKGSKKVFPYQTGSPGFTSGTL